MTRYELSPAFPQLVSGDIEITADFFENQLGFEIVAKYVDHQFLIVKKGAAEIHFWTAETSQAARSVASASSVYIRVKNVAALFDEYKMADIKFRYPLEAKPWGMNEFQIDDPFGNAIKFGEPTGAV